MDEKLRCSACEELITTNGRDCLEVRYRDELVSITCPACLLASKKLQITVERDGPNVTHYQTFTVEVA